MYSFKLQKLHSFIEIFFSKNKFTIYSVYTLSVLVVLFHILNFQWFFFFNLIATSLCSSVWLHAQFLAVSKRYCPDFSDFVSSVSSTCV